MSYHAKPSCVDGTSSASIGYLDNLGLVDERGQPFSARIQQSLRDLAPRFRRQFPMLNDEVFMVEVFEEAARRIAFREGRAGPVEKLYAYAWVIVRRIAAARLQHSSMSVTRSTLAPDQSQAALAAMTSDVGTVEQIERAILVQDVLAQLTPEERRLCTYKMLGLDSAEIAQQLGGSVSRVNTLFFRSKQKIRALRQSEPSGAGPRRSARMSIRRLG